MANRTLSDLPVTTVIAGANLIHTRQTTTDKSVTQAKIAEYAMNLSDYSPSVVAVTGATHTISTTIRKQLLICTIAANCTMTFPGAFGNAQEVTIVNVVASVANVIGLPNSEVLYPGQEITFIWNGTAFIKRGYITNTIIGGANPAITPFVSGQIFVDATGNRIWISTGTGSAADWTELTGSDSLMVDTAISFTILDTVRSETTYIITHGATGKMVVGSLPTLAANLGKIFNFKIVNNGIFQLLGEGAETINGITTQYCFSNGDYISVLATSTEWKVLKHNMNYETGGYNTNDQTNRHYGNVVVTFDGGAGTFLVGEKVREYSDVGLTTATGRFGTIIAVAATTLTLIFVDGVGTFTNDLYLLGMNSGATARPNGASKNADANILHLTGYYAKDFQISMWVTAATTFSQTASFLVITNNNGTTGWSLTEVDTTQFKIQTGSDSIRYLDDNGAIVTMSASDYAFNIYLHRSI